MTKHLLNQLWIERALESEVLDGDGTAATITQLAGKTRVQVFVNDDYTVRHGDLAYRR